MSYFLSDLYILSCTLDLLLFGCHQVALFVRSPAVLLNRLCAKLRGVRVVWCHGLVRAGPGLGSTALGGLLRCLLGMVGVVRQHPTRPEGDVNHRALSSISGPRVRIAPVRLAQHLVC